MSRLRATDPIRVGLGPCECVGSPHEEDEAWLRPRLRAEDAIAAMAILAEGGDSATLGRSLGMVFLTGGLLRWNILDDDGKPIPVEAVNSGALDWETTLQPIADQAADLYTPLLLAPLLRRA